MSGLAAVASGKCSIEDLKLSLKDPEYKVHGLGQPFPPWGLFLNNVEYNTKGLCSSILFSHLVRAFLKFFSDCGEIQTNRYLFPNLFAL